MHQQTGIEGDWINPYSYYLDEIAPQVSPSLMVGLKYVPIRQLYGSLQVGYSGPFIPLVGSNSREYDNLNLTVALGYTFVR